MKDYFPALIILIFLLLGCGTISKCEIQPRIQSDSLNPQIAIYVHPNMIRHVYRNNEYQIEEVWSITLMNNLKQVGLEVIVDEKCRVRAYIERFGDDFVKVFLHKGRIVTVLRYKFESKTDTGAVYRIVESISFNKRGKLLSHQAEDDNAMINSAFYR